MRSHLYITLLMFALTLIVGCGRGRGRSDGDSTCDLLAPQCAAGLVCSAVLEGEPRCVTPLNIRGIVVDATDDTPIAGALVQAVDVNGAAVGTSGETDDTGSYLLTVPALRDVEGTPQDGSYTLRAQAAIYQAFPSAIRPALPLDATTAVLDEGEWVIENTLTTVKLLPLPGDTSILGSISGTIEAQKRAGVLVIAERAAGAATGFSDVDGVYTIFNVPAGSYTVRGYAAGVQLDPTAMTLEAGEDVVDVDLSESDRPLSIVSGNVQIVNAPGGSQTSVVLAVESTFVDSAARGEVPPGLRVGGVLGAFAIADVPDGNYVVLAAFENDGLVRDPDQTIGGTQIVRIEVPDPVAGNTVELSEGFKVTGALAVSSPGADGPEEVFASAPVFTWEDDSSEDGYTIRVFDAFGNEIWNNEIDAVSGSNTVSDTYAGPALEPGMFYQFRATSWRDKNSQRTAISVTEDLMGVFQYVVAPGAGAVGRGTGHGRGFEDRGER